MIVYSSEPSPLLSLVLSHLWGMPGLLSALRQMRQKPVLPVAPQKCWNIRYTDQLFLFPSRKWAPGFLTVLLYTKAMGRAIVNVYMPVHCCICSQQPPSCSVYTRSCQHSERHNRDNPMDSPWKIWDIEHMV